MNDTKLYYAEYVKQVTEEKLRITDLELQINEISTDCVDVTATYTDAIGCKNTVAFRVPVRWSSKVNDVLKASIRAIAKQLQDKYVYRRETNDQEN